MRDTNSTRSTTRRSLLAASAGALTGLGALSAAGTTAAQEDTGWEMDLWPGYTVSSELDSEDPTRFIEQYLFSIEQGEPINMELTRSGGSGRFSFGIVGPGNERWGSTIVRPDETGVLRGSANQNGTHAVVIATLPETATEPPFPQLQVAGEYTLTWVEE